MRGRRIAQQFFAARGVRQNNEVEKILSEIFDFPKIPEDLRGNFVQGTVPY